MELLYNDMLVLRDPEWLQGELNVLISIFQMYGMVANVANSKAMTCHPGTLRSRISEEAAGRRCTSRGAT